MDQILKQYLPVVLGILVVGLVMWRRLRGMQQGRKVRADRLWIRPAIVATILALVVITSPLPNPTGLAICLAAAAAGLVAGYFFGMHQHFSRDVESGHVIVRTSPVGMILFFVLFALRFGLRSFFLQPEAGAGGTWAAHSEKIILFTDAMLTFVFALVVAQAWETWRRIKQLESAEAAAPKSGPIH